MLSMAPPALGPFAGAQAVHGVADRVATAPAAWPITPPVFVWVDAPGE